MLLAGSGRQGEKGKCFHFTHRKHNLPRYQLFDAVFLIPGKHRFKPVICLDRNHKNYNRICLLFSPMQQILYVSSFRKPSGFPRELFIYLFLLSSAQQSESQQLAFIQRLFFFFTFFFFKINLLEEEAFLQRYQSGIIPKFNDKSLKKASLNTTTMQFTKNLVSAVTCNTFR